jgi:hypothetical protein
VQALRPRQRLVIGQAWSSCLFCAYFTTPGLRPPRIFLREFEPATPDMRGNSRARAHLAAIIMVRVRLTPTFCP